MKGREDLKEFVIPISYGSTEIIDTGKWSSVKPRTLRMIPPCQEACPAGTRMERRDRLMILLLYGCGLRTAETMRGVISNDGWRSLEWIDAVTTSSWPSPLTSANATAVP